MLVKMAPQLSFEQFVFVEAAVSRPDIPQRFQMQSALTYLSWTRRDVWTSSESAINDFKSNPVFSSWDPRIFDLYMASIVSRFTAEQWRHKFGTSCVTDVAQQLSVRVWPLWSPDEEERRCLIRS